jgi:AraC-like DNA-binding protein
MLPLDPTSAPPIPLPEQGHFRGDRSDIFTDDGFPLALIHIHDHMPLGLHTHDFHELVLVLSGQAQHLTQDTSYPLEVGDAFVIKPGFAHGYSDPQGLEICNLLFDPVALALPRVELSRLPGYHGLFELEPSFRDLHRFQSRLFLAPDARNQVMGWVTLLAEELRERRDGYRHLSLGLLIRIIGFLARAYTGMTTPTSCTLLAVSRVVSHLEHHYATPLRLADLARMAHMCERSLQRYFQQAFGLSPVDYLNRLRVGKACQLLSERRLNVTQVADAVGIPDSSYFARMFHRLTGTTPSLYQGSSRRLQQAMRPLALMEHPRGQNRPRPEP